MDRREQIAAIIVGAHPSEFDPATASPASRADWVAALKKADDIDALTPRHEAPASEDEARRKLINCIDQWDSEMEYDAEDRASLADDILHAFNGPPIVSHEAPAEGAGEEINWKAEWEEACSDRIADRNAYDKGLFLARRDSQQIINERDGLIVELTKELEALRARSSAPEAREEALGNLLAVIHGDGGHRALEVGTKQAALEAEKIVARLLSSAPEAREREAVAWTSQAAVNAISFGSQATMWPVRANTHPIALYTHPAAQSTDKLRELVGASEDILSALSALSVAGKPIASLDTKLRDAINTLVPALAALQAEQKGGAA